MKKDFKDVLLETIKNEQNKTDADYDIFMKKYDKEHSLCPKCKSEKHTSTLVAYTLDIQNKELYKDLNECECQNCGDIHTAHDRVRK